jgi:hypothetical protein
VDTNSIHTVVAVRTTTRSNSKLEMSECLSCPRPVSLGDGVRDGMCLVVAAE